MKIFRGLVLLAVVLLAGCRAERAAFRFRPVLVQNSIFKVLTKPSQGHLSATEMNIGTAHLRENETRILLRLPYPSLELKKREKLSLLPISRLAKPLKTSSASTQSTHTLKSAKRERFFKAKSGFFSKSNNPTDFELPSLWEYVLGFGIMLLTLVGLAFLLAYLLGTSFLVGFGFAIISFIFLLVIARNI